MSEQALKIAMTLETLVAKTIADFELGLNVFRVPASVRAPMWEAIARRAMAKVIKCERSGA